MSVATIAFHNFYEELNRDNRLFEQRDAAIGDDLLLPFSELRSVAAERGITVATTAVLSAEAIDAYVFIDMPANNNPVFTRALASARPLYLIVMESRLVRPQNYDASLQRHFRKIFTYDDSLVDGERFIKLNYAFRLPDSIPLDLASKEKLCVMIAGYKCSRHPQELYSERLSAIRWFERHHPEDFDLYGVGWDKGRLGRRLPQWLTRRWGWLGRLGAPDVPSYRGRVERKRDVMGRYRFAFCYENVKDVPGYITEKLFDAFFAGTVPVYLGADNVSEHIPAGCFVDRRRFTSHEELYRFMKEMSDLDYNGYLSNIASFIEGERSYPFTTECFAKTILNGIVGE
jgi:alpha(1,3/1,4) fucosyltransferase